MKQVTQNYRTGEVRVEEVRIPALKPGGLLVRTCFSAVSAGTEGMKVREGKLSYLGKARARPDQLKKVLGSVQQQGLRATYEKVMNRLDSLTPLGYSLSGEVIAVGNGAEEFRVGQRVACAGAGYANHAEVNFVPKNLVVPVPADVSMRDAAFATIGAIAMQGYRQATMQLGETACVIGLGLLGQLLIQILRAGGMRVIGIDLVEARCRLAESLGAASATTPEDPGLATLIDRLSAGIGVDCVFLAAGGSSNAPVELAAAIARDRGRIVDIGKTKLDLPWNEYYMKELDVRFSRSYGPGRYDPVYEEGGIDYPIGYVRWTEKRNLSSFLELVAENKVRVGPIVSSIRPFSDAERVYQEIASGKSSALGTLFEYERSEESSPPLPQFPNSTRNFPHSGHTVRLGMIGAGNYASSMLLPHLRNDKRVELRTVATTKSLTAQTAAQKFGIIQASTDYREILDDTEIDTVVIATRHSSHAALVAESLRAGKTTFVEKPLAISREGLNGVRQAIQESGNGRLVVGFNRRFSPAVKMLAREFDGSSTPLVIHYRVHAGQIEEGSWYLDNMEGSRFVGESGHFFDVMSFLAQSRPISVSAISLRPEHVTSDDLENIVATVQYENGSIGNLVYLTQGDPSVPKEYIEVFGGGRTAILGNFSSVTVYEHKKSKKRRLASLDKGQKDELDEFIAAALSGTAMPIPLDSLFETSITTLATSVSLRTSTRIELGQYWSDTNDSREQD